MGDTVRVHLQISGRVQGVGFRYATRDEARALRLTGWVRNTPGGGVEVVAEGTPERLRRLVAWCHGGPPGALVTDVVEEWGTSTSEFGDFRIRISS